MNLSSILLKAINYIKSLFQKPTHLTQIMVGDKVIGVVQTICLKQKISNQPQTATLYRTRFDKDQISKAFNKGFIGKYQYKPFKILIGNKRNNLKLNNCWVKSISYQYEAGDIVIVEMMEIKYEDNKSKK